VLYVSPGVGADARLFDGIRSARAIRWIEPAEPREALPQYAERLAAQLRRSSLEEPFDLGGASFGGMVALELARHLSPRNVILFGSSRSPRGITRALRLVSLIPDRLLRPPQIVRPMIARWFGARSAPHAQLFSDMLDATSPSFFRWACHALASWEGVAELPMPVSHIHGELDHVIPIRLVNADHVIEGAGHLLTMTHTDAVNRILSGFSNVSPS
jgi:pimeloyl-ACP methyl ester carboxylesterase